VLRYVNAIPLCETCGENVIIHKSGLVVLKLFVEILHTEVVCKSRVVVGLLFDLKIHSLCFFFNIKVYLGKNVYY
jgi:hypothetical protein